MPPERGAPSRNNATCCPEEPRSDSEVNCPSPPIERTVAPGVRARTS
jgi:hypothetical protein